MRRVQDGFDDAGADGEVAEAFVIKAVLRPVFDPAVHNFEDFGFGNVFFKETRDAGAFSVAACVEVVAADGFADQTDFGEHGAAAAVGAAGDAQDDVFVFQTVFGEHFVDFVGERRQEAFGFRHRQRTGRQGDARH